MITPSELSRSIFGAWLLARFNKNGLTFFDNTVEGFWRSFWAAAIVLPAYAILLTMRQSNGTIGVGAGTAFYINSVSYVIGWIAFPFATYYVAQMFNRGQWYCRYIEAYNWAVVLQITLMLVVSLAAASGILPSGFGTPATIATIIFILIFKGYIARVALQTTLPGTVGIVFLDLCISLMLEGWSAKLLKLQPVVSG